MMKNLYKYTTITLIVLIAINFAYKNYTKNQYKKTVLSEFKQTYKVLSSPKLETSESGNNYFSVIHYFFKETYNKELPIAFNRKKTIDNYFDRILTQTDSINFIKLDSLQNSKYKFFLNPREIERLDEAFFQLKILEKQVLSLIKFKKGDRFYNDTQFFKTRREANLFYANIINNFTAFCFEPLHDVRSRIRTVIDQLNESREWTNTIDKKVNLPKIDLYESFYDIKNPIPDSLARSYGFSIRYLGDEDLYNSDKKAILEHNKRANDMLKELYGEKWKENFEQKTGKVLNFKE